MPIVGGIAAFSNASVAFITPMISLAGSAWPKLSLICQELCHPYLDLEIQKSRGSTYRSYEEGCIFSCGYKDLSYGRDLDSITCGCVCTMTFEIVGLMQREPSAAVCLTNKRSLSLSTRIGDACSTTIATVCINKFLETDIITLYLRIYGRTIYKGTNAVVARDGVEVSH